MLFWQQPMAQAPQPPPAVTQVPLPGPQTLLEVVQLVQETPRGPHLLSVWLAKGTQVAPSQQPSQSPHGLPPMSRSMTTVPPSPVPPVVQAVQGPKLAPEAR